MPPLIKIKLVLNGILNIFGIYDSGSNVSLINSKLLNLKTNKIKNAQNTQNANLKTINGVKKTVGMITINVNIFAIETNINVFVVDNKDFNHDFLVGLDCIKKFRLRQNEKLEITQKIIPENPGENVKNIISESKKKEYKINFNEHVNMDHFEIKVSHLETAEKAEIENLIDKYKTIFSKDKYDIGTVKDYEARIDLLIDTYCNKRPYRCTLEDKKEIEQQISKLLKTNLIEESYSPFAAPVTLAYKKEEGKRSRLCIDFRELNKIVVPQAQPFPLIEDLVEKTRDSTFFTTLDINSAFWSIPLRIEDRHKTAFVTQEGHFQWTCLPFGLKTSPAIFQRILSNIIRKNNLSDFSVNYIDDILIFSKTFQEHIKHLNKLLNAIMKEGFRLKLSKCTFAANSVKYLGHIIKKNSVSPLKDNLVSVRDFPIPKTRKNIRQFLGKINFYNKYIPNNSIILDSLHNLLRKGQHFTWTGKCQESFEKIKSLLCSQPILAIFNANLPIYIYTDASIQGVGAVLKQPQEDNEEKPVAYFSKKLKETQKKHKAIYLECLAIKEAVKYWQYRLIGKKFTVFSDHKPLEKMNLKVRTDEELGDLAYYLSQYDFEIKYSPGRYNLEADCLSRNPVLQPNENEDESLNILNLITLEDIQNDQEKNEELNAKTNKVIQKDKIYYKKIGKKDKIILTEEVSKQFIKNIHQYYCHIGIKQLQNKIQPFYNAKNLAQNIKTIYRNYEVCIKNKSRGQFKFGLMSQLGPATKPFEIISIDTIGGFGGSTSTKKYLHLLVDHFTRFAYILTSKTQNSKDFIKLMEKATENQEVGMVLSDQYPGINSKEFKQYLDSKHIPIVFTAVNAPFSNGLNERLNQTLINKIRCKMNEKKKLTWTTIAHECTKRYNDTEHTITGFAPKYLLEGKNITILPSELKQNKTHSELLQDRKLALENSIKSHNYNKQKFDKKRRDYEFNIGDLVYVENGNRLNRKKLDELKIGPYKVLEKISNSIYKIDTGHSKSQSNIFHITKLVPTQNLTFPVEGEM